MEDLWKEYGILFKPYFIPDFPQCSQNCLFFVEIINNDKQAGAELGQAQPKLGLKVEVCILGWGLKYEVEI